MGLLPFEFRCPPLIRVGRGVFARVGADANDLGMKRPLIVADAYLAETGLVDRLVALCQEAELSTALYSGVEQEPLTRHVEEGLTEYRQHEADGVIALGGGCTMDTAKAVAAMSTNPGRISDYVVPARLRAGLPPLVCLPTTAGTGSEVTRFCIITDPEANVKMLISDPRLLPAVALADAELTDTCPPNVTAATGVDALTHAIEAYVSRRANPYSALLALSAIRRISGHLRRAFADGADKGARDAMMLGQLEAGLAFSNASVCLVHGMARPLGAYFHVPHGLANAMLLPVVMEWSLAAAAPAYAEIARALGCATEKLSDEAAARAGAAEVAALSRDLELPSLAEAAGGRAQIEAVAAKMADDAIASGSPANNPRVPTQEDIVALYQKALATA
ncbi:MAG: iron-containing alcohol dehydrogenase [Armatimonadetes bacterium]|nr:iron-containing alcohol dehydrogenase [Armatimonadota bacterium]